MKTSRNFCNKAGLFKLAKLAQRFNARNPDELAVITKGDFTSREQWIDARKVDTTTLIDYQFYLDACKVRDMLLKFELGIPVSLTRIVELIKIPRKILESLINSLAQKEEIGKYLPLEQVFVRSSPEDALIEKAFEEWTKAEKDKLGKK